VVLLNLLLSRNLSSFGLALGRVCDIATKVVENIIPSNSRSLWMVDRLHLPAFDERIVAYSFVVVHHRIVFRNLLYCA
jgi:hypothetical protein